MSEQGQPASPPKRQHFRRPRSIVALDPQYLDRQRRIANLAFGQLGGRDGAVTFLNSHNAILGGKPLDLAGQSRDGYAAVREELYRLALRLSGSSE